MSVRVDEVAGRRGRARFVGVPWALHAGRGTLWTPPLRVSAADLIDDRRNPFYRNADRALFVAEKAGRVAGRIAAVENRWHNEHHGDDVGFFGFFDCIDDAEVAARLFESAESWLRDRGLTASRGPTSPSMNHECGLLVDGFEQPAVVMTTWNEPYLGPLVESAGYRKARDLLGYYMPSGEELAVPERMQSLARLAIERTRVTFREIDVRNLEQEARDIHGLYCEAWADNWGFVPPSWDEFWHSAKDLKTVLARRYSFVAEHDGEAVGFLVVVKDVHRILRRMPSGRLWPWNIARLLIGLPKVSNNRIILLGLKEEYRRRGLFSILAYEAARRGRAGGEEGGEASWILDDNDALIRPFTGLGFRPYKRWRIYEKPLR